MGLLKGQIEFKKWKDKKPLTRKEAMLAMCYQCNGEEQSNEYCQGKDSCPMYAFAPYSGA